MRRSADPSENRVIEAPDRVEAQVVEIRRDPSVEDVSVGFDIGNSAVAVAFGVKPKDVHEIASVILFGESHGKKPVTYSDGSGATLRINGEVCFVGAAAIDAASGIASRTDEDSYANKPRYALPFLLASVQHHRPKAKRVRVFVEAQAQHEAIRDAMRDHLEGVHTVAVLSTDASGKVTERELIVEVVVLQVVSEAIGATIAATKTKTKASASGKVEPVINPGAATVVGDIGWGTFITLAYKQGRFLGSSVVKDNGVRRLVHAIANDPSFLRDIRSSSTASIDLLIQGLIDGTMTYWASGRKVSFQSYYEQHLPLLVAPIATQLRDMIATMGGVVNQITIESGGSKLPGVLDLLQEEFPDIAVRSSGLGSVANVIGLKFLADMNTPIWKSAKGEA